MDYGYKYSAAVSEAFSASVNQLPVLREAIATAYPNILPDNRQASVVSVFMVSDAAFTVSFNLGVTGLVARLNAAGDYELSFSGSISHLAFAAETTLTTFEIEWYPDAINYKTVTFDTVPETAVTIVVKDQYGNTYIASEDGTYELLPGHYVCYADHEDYDAIVVPFFVMADSETVDVVFDQATEYTITFALTPTTSTVVVRTAGGTVVAPVSPKVYSLEDSTVAGIYTYTVSKAGYTDATGTLDVQADATETVSISVATWDAVYEVTPTGSTFVLSDSDETPITPDSIVPEGTFTYNGLDDSYVAGDYSYSASLAGYATDTGTLSLHADATESVDLVALEWEVVYAVTPVDATFVLEDVASDPVTPDSLLPEGTYTFDALADSRAAGNYAYSASKTGYVTETGALDLQADTSEVLSLEVATYERIFTVVPTDATFVLKDSLDNVITPDSTTPEGTYTFDALEDSRVSGDYDYTVSKEDYVTQSGSLTATDAGTIETTLVLELVSIAVTTPPTKTDYFEGELFDDTGMVVTAAYADESTDVITEYTYTPDGELATSDTNITISYTEGLITVDTDQAIVVSPILLDSIAITTPPTKTAYSVGEPFDPTAMVVTATYTDLSTDTVTSYTYSPDGNLAVEDTVIIVSYSEGEITKTTTQAITVT